MPRPDPDIALLATQELYETTRDICGRLDLEDALQAIVRRANTLLDGDLAYLATCDDEHEVLRMRSFDKVRSASFKSLVVPYGVGVGGAVARHRQPRTVADYQASDELTHSPEIDASADDEGIRSGVAAPVEFESRLLAILFVAKRTPFQFSDQQVTMLGSLANAAAIAINNAQIHGRLVAAMAIHNSLMDLALADRGPSAVTSTLAELIKGPVLFLDWRGSVVATSAFAGRSLHVRAAAALLGDGLPAGGEGAITVPIRIAGVVEGFLLAAPDDQQAELAEVAIEQTVTVLALELLKTRSAEQVELRLRGGVFSELLNYPPADEHRLRREALQLGCDLSTAHLVCVVRFRDQRTLEAPQPWQRLGQMFNATLAQADSRALVVDRGDSLALVLRAEDEVLLQRALDQVRRAGLPPVVAGVGGRAEALEGYAQSYAEATRAVDAANHLAALGGLVRFEDLGLHQVLLGARPTTDLSRLARRMLAPLLDQDASRGTELVDTARVFLDKFGNVEAMARELGLHPNSVRGRLNRIAKLLGRDLDDARTRLDLHLALEAFALSAGE